MTQIWWSRGPCYGEQVHGVNAASDEKRSFAFDEAQIFGKYELFARRCRKLEQLFSTIHQFSGLAQHTHIDGLSGMIKRVEEIVDDVKRRPYDLLDFTNNAFDRDFLEFNVNVNDLEVTMQVSPALQMTVSHVIALKCSSLQ